MDIVTIATFDRPLTGLVEAVTKQLKDLKTILVVDVLTFDHDKCLFIRGVADTIDAFEKDLETVLKTRFEIYGTFLKSEEMNPEEEEDPLLIDDESSQAIMDWSSDDE